MSALISIRRADVSDQRCVLEIENRCFTSDKISPRQVRYLLSVAKATTHLAMDGTQAIGYGLCLLPTAPRPARLYSLAVLPAWRKQQVARRLCESLFAELRSRRYSRCRLEVRHSESAVQNFYISLGFRPIIELPGYYQDQEDGLRMECMLNEQPSYTVA